jgi:hypothetical protein
MRSHDGLAEWNLANALDVWSRHMPGCDCPGCLYVEAHIDDEVEGEEP